MKENKIILAIDKNNFNEAFDLCKEVQADVGFFKLGLEFFYSFGSEGVNKIAKLGVPIFLDLKLHDIPNTVSKASLALIQNVTGVKILTLHCGGGVEMLKKTNEAMLSANFLKPMVFGVTVLTSIGKESGQNVITHFPFALATLRALNKLNKFLADGDKASIEIIKAKLKVMIEVANNTLHYWVNLYDQEKLRIEEANKTLLENEAVKGLNLKLELNPKSEFFYEKNLLNGGILNSVLHYASLAHDAGIEGIVCSGLEAKFVKTFFPDLQIITPGIRSKWCESNDDQQRVLTPKEAIENGADFIVIGRQITNSANPKEALQKTLLELYA